MDLAEGKWKNPLLYNCLVGLITCTLFEIGEIRRIRSRWMKVELYRYRLASRVCENRGIWYGFGKWKFAVVCLTLSDVDNCLSWFIPWFSYILMIYFWNLIRLFITTRNIVWIQLLIWDRTCLKLKLFKQRELIFEIGRIIRDGSTYILSCSEVIKLC